MFNVHFVWFPCLIKRLQAAIKSHISREYQYFQIIYEYFSSFRKLLCLG
ncbi:hypothetical protein VCR29J2_320003 [Vibrio coralliirubri]|nr:hypothetical protein VCR29J2_320003 [Vibrio coralliirubri]